MTGTGITGGWNWDLRVRRAVRPLCRRWEVVEMDTVIGKKGAGFLYNMVRIIAGSLMEIGSGKYEPSHIKEVLEKTDRCEAGPTAEPQGLTMVGIIFEGEKGYE